MDHHHSSLHQNPFQVLRANTRDTRKSILEKADERALHFDAEQCQKARSDLTNPRSRVAAEIAWLPGVSPRMAEKLVTDLPANPMVVGTQTGLPELARANLMCAALELVDAAAVAPADMSSFMRTFGDVADDIDLDAVLRDINEDRAVAGFIEVRDTAPIEEELDQRRKHYKVVLKNALDRMPSVSLVETMTLLVNAATNDGEHAGPPLIDDLVDSYEVETQGFLSKEQENVQKLIKAALSAAPAGGQAVDAVIGKIESVVKNWAFVGKPIQTCMKSRGLEHRHSLEVGSELRQLVFKLIVDHQMVAQSQRITKLLVNTFGDLPEFQERVQDDALALEEIGKRAVKAEKEVAEERRLITFKAEVGLLFKDQLSISPEGIQWKDRHYDLEKITAVRWGGVRKSVNGIPTGTDYTIGFADNRGSSEVSISREQTYTRFINCLWRAVGVRLLVECAEGLNAGKTFTFGPIEIDDASVVLTRHRTLRANEKVRVPMSQLSIWSAGGSFNIRSSEDKSVQASLSYIESWNTHVLENLMRSAFEKGNGRSFTSHIPFD